MECWVGPCARHCCMQTTWFGRHHHAGKLKRGVAVLEDGSVCDKFGGQPQSSLERVPGCGGDDEVARDGGPKVREEACEQVHYV